MAKKSQTKNKTTKKTKSAPVAVNPNANPPNKTLRSKGFFYVSEKPKDSGKWRVMFESWKDGKKKQTQISKAMFAELGLTPTMTVAQARAEIKKYNKIRKTSLKITASQVRALRRLEELKAIDKTLFPDDLVDEFVMRVQAGSDGKPRFKNRLITNFKIVMEMAKELKLQPHDYSTNVDLMVAYMKDERRKYSVSYCKDIFYILNKWGVFYSRKHKTFFEPVGKLRIKTQNAISTAHKDKNGVRKESQPMTEELLKKVRGKIDDTQLDEIKKYNWLFISFVFGLRPSECDDAIKNPKIETHGGVPALLIYQSKLTVVDEDEKDKRIPIICEEQEKALNLIEKKQALRPSPKWVDKHCKDERKTYDANFKYDLYCGRKGFTDFLLSKGQSLEQISIWAGHKSIETTWHHYKDKRSIRFNETAYTKKKYKKAP